MLSPHLTPPWVLSPPFSIILFVIFWRVRPRRSFTHHPCTICKATQPPALLEMTECRRVKARRLSALIAPKQRIQPI